VARPRKLHEGATSLNVRIDPDLLVRIDGFRERQLVPPTRADVVRVAIESFLRLNVSAETKP